MLKLVFSSTEYRNALMDLARDGSKPSRVTRRANALVLLDTGLSRQQVANALLLDDDTVRGFRKLFEQHDLRTLAQFDAGASSSYLGASQEDWLKAWAAAELPAFTREVEAYIADG